MRIHVTRLFSAYRHMDARQRPRMPLGLMALSLGYITPEQLREALDQQREQGGRIGEVLVSLGFLEPAQVTAALAAQWGHPVLSLKNRQLQVSNMIPFRLMQFYSMLPVHYIAQTNKLVLGFSEFVEHRTLATIEKMLGCTVVPCFITGEDFENNLPLFRVQRSREEVVFEQPSSVAEIARATRSYAWQISAQTAKFGLCGGYIWGRLQAPRISMDLLSGI